MRITDDYEFLTADDGETALVIGDFDATYDEADASPLPLPKYVTLYADSGEPTLAVDASRDSLFLFGMTRHERLAGLELAGVPERIFNLIQRFPYFKIFEVGANGGLLRCTEIPIDLPDETLATAD